ncbi:DUF6801 domain-containing protein [Amycolatopsis sp. CA-128772]|uniref:DUF6801 domain-containing protein n=1 Tax=Amycolatopsis sp. CA-128772 TaxID=2073159 RepID=UPI000CD07045|nr:DUF6801 domain-containing protein [Amycolatopsis sp. CA-128772]
MRLFRSLVLTLITTAALAGAAAPAHASTAFHSGAVGYTCQFPDGSPQTVTLVAGFTGPDTVAPGVGFALSGVSGTVTLTPAAQTWFTSRGSDGFAGGRVAVFTEAANGPRSANPGAATIQPSTWGAGPAVASFSGGRSSHTAGSSGTITFTAGQLVLLLSLHRADGEPAFSSVICHPQDGQDTTFTPALPIS